MKTLIMLSAIPASGKSTWAAEYKKKHENTFIVSSDEVRMEVTHGDFQDHSKQAEVWRLFEERIHEYGRIEDCTVILDALNDVNLVRLKYLESTPEFDHKVLVLFPNTIAKARKYNNLREKAVRVPDDILVQLVNKFEAPSKRVLDLVDEIVQVNW